MAERLEIPDAIRSNYEIVRVIGKGTFGVCLLGQRKHDAKLFAIKQIRVSVRRAVERKYVFNEVRLLSNLHHPNVIAYHDCFVAECAIHQPDLDLEEHRLVSIVMEFADGGDLSDKISSAKGVHFPENMCLGLKYIHDRHMLHRDLKPHNVFLSKHNVVKLGDFGIAKELSSPAEFTRTVVGTPSYLSPEVVDGKPYNYKSDVWGLGCILYELLTLKRAFSGKNLPELISKIRVAQLAPISLLYGPELRALSLNLLRVQPDERPSIRDVLAMPLLQRILGRFVDVADRAVRDSMLDWSSLPVTDTVSSESAQVPQSDGNVLTTTNELDSEVDVLATLKPSIVVQAPALAFFEDATIVIPAKR